ncbi:MAG: hypothetical protein LBD23_19450 [Oscillospiraceae bacterium]|jgi:hypothetical protein|nr:hypothetical protein [Oscillospiraceae bacterium]
MKSKLLMGLLCVVALLSITLSIMQASFAGVFSSAMAFPFEQIAIVLRMLSLSGKVGNVAAIIAYCIVCLLPIAFILVLRVKRKLFAEDGLLVLLSAVLFAVLYIMINPSIIGGLVGSTAMETIRKAVLGITVYSILCGYFILRVLRLFINGGMEQLMRYMSIMLGLLNALFVIVIFGVLFNSMLDSIRSLSLRNVGNEHLLGTSYVFLVMQFIVNALPYIFNIIVVFAALRLFEEMRLNRFSDETVVVAKRISHICAVALVVMVLVNIVFNVLQLLFANQLMIINSSVQFPIISIIFVLAALLFTRLIAENKELKDDIDMFV